MAGIAFEYNILTAPEANMLLYGANTTLKCDTALLTERSKHRIPKVDKKGRIINSDGEVVEPKIGDILAIKSTSIPYEICAENLYTNFDKIVKNKASSKSRYSRKKTEGNGLYIYGSVEYVIYTGEPQKKSTLKKKEKVQLLSHKNVRLYPATGRAQIPGIKPGVDNPRELLSTVLSYVSEDLQCETAYDVIEEKNNMVNSKLSVKSDDPNEYIDLYTLSILFEEIRQNNTFPFTIIFVTEKHMVCSHMFIRFATPIENNSKRKTTLKIFSSKKINVFGSPSFEITNMLCAELDKEFVKHRDEIIKLKDTSTAEVVEETEITKLF